MSHETRKKVLIGILIVAGAYFAVYFARVYFPSGGKSQAEDAAAKTDWECVKCKSRITLTAAEFDVLALNPEKLRYGVFKTPREPGLNCEKCKTFSMARVRK